MTSRLDICNMALRHVASTGGEIADFDTERSKEAQACRRFYGPVRDEVLRDFPWPFATVFETLALVEESPTVEWYYSYRYPAECLAFRRILNGSSRVESRATRVSFRVGQDSSGLLIYTDQQTAVGEWTTRVTDPTRYAPDFVMAFSLLLASRIAASVAGGDQFKLGDHALVLYQQAIAKARQNAFNEAQEDQEPPSALELARG